MAVSAGEVWETAKHAIASYTGLSPAIFFTVLALALAVYYVVSGFFAPAPPPRRREVELEQSEPLLPPVQLGEITEEELLVYDGSDSKKPVLMAIKGQIYDVTQSRMFYGPGGPYALFAGKDASRALAKMSFEQKDLTGDITGLGPFELEALQDWEYKFMSKYVKVGTIKKTVAVADGSSENTIETTSTVTDTTEGAHVAVAERSVEREENDTAEQRAESVVSAESEVKEVHVAEAERSVEREENGQAEQGAESVVSAESEVKEVEVKEVCAGDGTKD